MIGSDLNNEQNVYLKYLELKQKVFLVFLNLPLIKQNVGSLGLMNQSSSSKGCNILMVDEEICNMYQLFDEGEVILLCTDQTCTCSPVPG